MAALPIITPSTPVYSNIFRALSSSTIFPFPITGILTFSFTFLIISRSTSPLKNSALVLPCTVIILAPDFSIILAASTATTLSSFQPFLIFTLTGTFEDFTTSVTISSTLGKSNKSLLPSPFFITFGAGHPIFISNISANPLTYSAATFKDSTSLPNI